MLWHFSDSTCRVKVNVPQLAEVERNKLSYSFLFALWSQITLSTFFLNWNWKDPLRNDVHIQLMEPQPRLFTLNHEVSTHNGKISFLSVFHFLIPGSSAAIDALWWGPWVMAAWLHLCESEASSDLFSHQVIKNTAGRSELIIDTQQPQMERISLYIHLWTPTVHTHTWAHTCTCTHPLSHLSVHLHPLLTLG